MGRHRIKCVGSKLYLFFKCQTWRSLHGYCRRRSLCFICAACAVCSLIQLSLTSIASPFHLYHRALDTTADGDWAGQDDPEVGFRKLWVGFPELRGTDCVTALTSRVKNHVYRQNVSQKDVSHFKQLSQDCTDFRGVMGFNRYPEVSQEEMGFPIAFVILFHKDLDQVLFLLRAIYRPHNVYCLSVDTKSSIEFLEAVRAVVRCLPNVFVSSKLENIVYAGFSRLMADIDCMEDLLQHPVKWKYVINMPGQQFPLRTNLELVKILKMFNGTNNIEGNTREVMPDRYQWRYEPKKDDQSGSVTMVKTDVEHRPIPHNLRPVKSSAYGAFSREFVSFVFHSSAARDVLEWSRWLYSPDEYYWAILNFANTLAVPGGYKGRPDDLPFLTSYAVWPWSGSCASDFVRDICIFSPEDLQGLAQRPELFANKFYLRPHPAALHCMDELLYNQTFTRAARHTDFYRNLTFFS